MLDPIDGFTRQCLANRDARRINALGVPVAFPVSAGAVKGESAEDAPAVKIR